MRRGMAKNCGVELKAAPCRVLVICSTVELTDRNFRSSKLTDGEKASQYQLGCQDSSGALMEIRMLI
jgi:hypothetical protein